MICKEELIIGVIIVVLAIISLLFYLSFKWEINEEYRDILQCSYVHITIAVLWVASCAGHISYQ